MTKQEFLQGLRAALEGEVPLSVIQENLRYYEGYIDTEVRNGRAELDVTAEIGEPRWIAKTIIETTPGAGDGAYEIPEEPYREDYTGSSQRDSYSGGRPQGSFHYYNLNKWYVKLIVILVLIFVFWLMITIIGGVLSLLLPLLPIIALVAFIAWIIRGMGR